MPSQMISTAKLLVVLISVSSVMGYQSVSNRPFARPFGVQDIKSDSVLLKEPQHTATRRNKPTYDLGLGKNKPVYGVDASYDKNDEEATRFLVEYESVRTYPSPLETIPDVNERAQAPKPTTTTKPKKILPKVQLKRKVADSLSIGSDNGSDIPQIRTTQSGAQLDLNTVWVEMMIHSEQSKLIPAAMSI